jgi:hypothetical protein
VRNVREIYFDSQVPKKKKKKKKEKNKKECRRQKSYDTTETWTIVDRVSDGDGSMEEVFCRHDFMVELINRVRGGGGGRGRN